MLPPLILYTQVLLLHSLVEEEQRGDHTGCNEIHLKNTISWISFVLMHFARVKYVVGYYLWSLCTQDKRAETY